MIGIMLLVGFFLPALIGVVNRKVADSDARFWISFFICGIVGIAVNFLTHNGSYMGMTMLDIANTWADSILVMTGMVKLSYEAVWDKGLLQAANLKYPEK